MRRMPLLVGALWLAGGAATVAHARNPDWSMGTSATSAAALESVAAVGSLLLAALLYGRWQQRRTASDLAATAALSVLAAANTAFVLLPLLAGRSAGSHARPAAVVGGAAAAAAFMLAAWVRERPTARWSVAQVGLGLGVTVTLTLGLAAAAAALTGPRWHELSGLPSSEGVSGGGDLVLAIVQAGAAGCFALASVLLLRRAIRSRDRFLGWLSVTAALWALARLNYAVTPSHDALHLTLGDWLRLSAYAVAVLAAASELRTYWTSMRASAILEERRRIARDLHDGLAQELAFIATQSRALAGDETGERAALVARAAERALDESRRAIAALTRPLDEPFEEALAQQAEELGGRMGVRVQLDLQPVRPVPADAREALLRVAREAITNAGRHGRPARIVVQLCDGNGLTLRISDDGRGFRPDDPKHYAGDRWGIAGMRERVQALGGSFTLQSRPYGGTKVEVWVP